MADESALSRVHYELIQGLIEQGACPTNEDLSRRMGIAPVQVEELLHALANIHGVVLHSHVCEPWIVHPFSLTPTINWIEGKEYGWWAPCVWCALGVAALVRGKVQVHTRYGGEAESLVIPVVDGQLVGFEEVVVHFAIPPSKAWDNVHQHCSMVLPFRRADDIGTWCKRHSLPHGEAVPLHQVVRLAQLWYGSHANSDWRKWTLAEAQTIFHQAGLISEFWELRVRSGKF